MAYGKKQTVAFYFQEDTMMQPFGFGGVSMAMFDIIPMLIMIGFVVILACFAAAFASGIRTWNRNNHSPRLTVEAEIVSRRTDVSRHIRHDGPDGTMSHSTTTYYATFQVASGDRMEFCIPSNEYGYLVEGDRGTLTFQGTRYLSFERTR